MVMVFPMAWSLGQAHVCQCPVLSSGSQLKNDSTPGLLGTAGEKASERVPETGQWSRWLRVRVVVPEFLIAQVGGSAKLEAAAELGVASGL